MILIQYYVILHGMSATMPSINGLLKVHRADRETIEHNITKIGR